MMAWLNPGALVALSAAVLPIVIHLLLRNRATTVRVPSIRFMVQTRESAVGLSRPSNLLLLLIRTAILVCAAIALAAPLVTIDTRKAHWLGQTRRAVVVDVSESVDPSASAEAAAAQSSGAASAQRFEAAEVAAGIERASAWLRHAPPGRLELVVVSDFQAGAVTAASFASVPPDAAIRTATVPRRAAAGGEIDGGVVLYGPRRYAQRITLDGAGTAYALRETGATSGVEFLKGASTSPGTASLAKTVAAAGIFAPPAEIPAVVVFTPPGRAAETTDPAAIVVDAPAESLQAAIVVHEVLTTRRDLPGLMEFEPQTIPTATIDSWSRDAARSDTRRWDRFEGSDARWFWLASIALLGVETILRRDRQEAPVERANAA
ncbi:MAG: BatA domain-containing protein [Vicinamibacterales bacterium]